MQAGAAWPPLADARQPLARTVPGRLPCGCFGSFCRRDGFSRHPLRAPRRFGIMEESKKGTSMPDIALRFHKDMLVLSAPLAAVLAR